MEVQTFKEMAIQGVQDVLGVTFQFFRRLLVYTWLCIRYEKEERTQMMLLFDSSDGSSPFEDLNEDCILQIARLLDIQDRRNLTQTCSRWRNVIHARSSPAFDTRHPVVYVEFAFDTNVHSTSPMNCSRLTVQDHHMRIPDPELRKRSLVSYLTGRAWPMQDTFDELCTYWMPDNIIFHHREDTPPSPQAEACAVPNRRPLLQLIENAFSALGERQSITLRLHSIVLTDGSEHQLISAFLNSTAKLLLLEAPSAIQAIFIVQKIRSGARASDGWKLVGNVEEEHVSECTLRTCQLQRGAERKSIGTFYPTQLGVPCKIPVNALAVRFRTKFFIRDELAKLVKNCNVQ